MNKLVAFVGPRGCGKDTMAAVLVETEDFETMAFADPLRHVLSYLYDIDIECFTDRVLKEQGHPNLPEGKTIRDVMQFVGTEICRSLDPDIWTKFMARRLKASEGNVVITDVRFPNEVEFVTQHGGNSVYVLRQQAEGQLHKNNLEGNLHESEAHNLDFIKSLPIFENNIDVRDELFDGHFHNQLKDIL